MFLAELRIENFRMYGEGNQSLVLPFRPGLTALVGENDTGKSAVIDALRLVFGTRDQEFLRLEESDFHQPADGTPRRTEIRILCRFEDLSPQDLAAFLEYLSYEQHDASKIAVFYVNWRAVVVPKPLGQRRLTTVEVRSGRAADGPQLDPETRNLLCATYLRPLRDAERSLSAGRGSRLSQILQHTQEIRDHGEDFDPETGPPRDLGQLSVLGIGDLANSLLTSQQGVQKARNRLNTDFLGNLSFRGDQLQGSISVSGSKGDASVRRRQLLEKLELELRDEKDLEPPPGRGLGSNNLLFMACELLLLRSELDGFPLLLIEEPEAHLHPQRQLRLMQFLEQKVGEVRTDGQRIQIVVTTHSPTLASGMDLQNLVLMHRGKAFPMANNRTQLDQSDYGFLKRFLDSTKANMFFARGLLIVEGDAENILLPTLARLLGRDLTENGVSIVNVGGTGLRRFARIYLRKYPEQDGVIDVPVACVADYDVMPDCAPEIFGKVKPGTVWPPKHERRWRAKADFTAEELHERRSAIRAKASGQNVDTFVSDEWTLEYDLAYFGLAKQVWIAAHLAKNDAAIRATSKACIPAALTVLRSFKELNRDYPDKENLASRVYAILASDSTISKATTAQYLASLLEAQQKKGRLAPDTLRSLLPPYLVKAIEFVTVESPVTSMVGEG